MKKMVTNLIAAILALSLLQCVNKQNKMNSYISIFEIPAKDLKKAITFYESILDIKIEKMELQGIKMGVLPYENQQVTGLIVEAQGYEPSTNGITVYLNAGEDLQIILDKIVKNGGKILIPKTPHADGNGFFAIFIDSEGNKMGLNSEK